jgi:hypothetical protein
LQRYNEKWNFANYSSLLSKEIPILPTFTSIFIFTKTPPAQDDTAQGEKNPRVGVHVAYPVG